MKSLQRRRQARRRVVLNTARRLILLYADRGEGQAVLYTEDRLTEFLMLSHGVRRRRIVIRALSSLLDDGYLQPGRRPHTGEIVYRLTASGRAAARS